MVVDFYATWCVPCRSYTPKFQRAYRELRRRRPDVAFEFVSVDVDRDHALARAHRVRSVPTTVVLAEARGWFGRRRRVATARWSGDKAWPDLLRTLEDALG